MDIIKFLVRLLGKNAELIPPAVQKRVFYSLIISFVFIGILAIFYVVILFLPLMLR